MQQSDTNRPVSTFSIVARDAETGDFGVAVASKFLAVGAVVPWAQAGIGAVATQAWANTGYGPDGLHLLAAGRSAEAVVAALTAADAGRESRQLGVVDAQGGAASFTGTECNAWAGGIVGEGFACQGNILAGPEVVGAMAGAYRAATGSLAERLVAALDAGQAAGGDSRGQQSAALFVVREGGGYGGGTDRYIDLRVDDHPRPIEELRRLLRLHAVYFQHEAPELIPLDAALRDTLRRHLHRLGFLSDGDSDEANVQEGLARFAGVENLEERLRDDDQIDAVVLDLLRQKAGEA